ncbi:hypothetical protein KL942_002280 [Ogataea angusta]|uniref:Something about silencing protein 4 domain-containing protein n=1 Tax=Pichia angusta TaxID=870730 RepID=A0ABQ7RYZ7_PICAN|nr:hypothetical protein KL942_002280 [Ogataea angusta]KAG7850237.1 hypothetical protein KL940_001797 [Ogataea angusta]
MKLLGTNPSRTSLYEHATNFRWDNSLRRDEFAPASFVSSRNQRLNFDRLNDRSSILDNIKDSTDELYLGDQQFGAMSNLRVSLDALRLKLPFLGQLKPATPAKVQPRGPRKRQVQLSYYGEETADDAESRPLFMKQTSVRYKKKAKSINDKKAAGSVVQYESGKFLEYPPISIPQAPADYVSANFADRSRQEAAKGLLAHDYQLILDNYSYVPLDDAERKFALYLYLQSRLHDAETPVDTANERLLQDYLNSLKNNKFVESTDDTDVATSEMARRKNQRVRRMERRIELDERVARRLGLHK